MENPSISDGNHCFNGSSGRNTLLVRWFLSPISILISFWFSLIDSLEKVPLAFVVWGLSLALNRTLVGDMGILCLFSFVISWEMGKEIVFLKLVTLLFSAGWNSALWWTQVATSQCAGQLLRDDPWFLCFLVWSSKADSEVTLCFKHSSVTSKTRFDSLYGYNVLNPFLCEVHHHNHCWNGAKRGLCSIIFCLYLDYAQTFWVTDLCN